MFGIQRKRAFFTFRLRQNCSVDWDQNLVRREMFVDFGKCPSANTEDISNQRIYVSSKIAKTMAGKEGTGGALQSTNMSECLMHLASKILAVSDQQLS